MKHSETPEAKSDKTVETQQESRRKAMKTLMAAGGIVTGSKVLSSEWARPVVESVVLPAHAQTSTAQTQTSTAIAGTFTTSIVSTRINRDQLDNDKLLDLLIPAANAWHNDVAQSACGGDEDPTSLDGGAYELMFNISGTTVKVCFSSVGNNGYQDCTKEYTTSLSGNSIADFSFVIDDALDNAGDQESAVFSGVTVSADGTQIAGQLDIVDSENNSVNCGFAFTSDITPSSYTCVATCANV